MHPRNSKVMMIRFLLLIAIAATTSSYRIVCYYSSWAQFGSGVGKLEPENINATLCTHIVFAYITISAYGVSPLYPDDYTKTGKSGTYARILQLRKVNPDVKILLAIAGNNDKWFPYKYVVATPASRSLFAQNVRYVVNEYGFDGIDVNMFYPETRRVPPYLNQAKTIALFMELYNIFDANRILLKYPRSIISASLPAVKTIIDKVFDPVAILKFVDFISITTYEFHGNWDGVTGLSAAVQYPREDEYESHEYESHEEESYEKESEERLDNIVGIINYYLKLGVPRSKINIGIPASAESFTLDNPRNAGLGAPAKKPGIPGKHTNKIGFMAQYEVCQFLKSGAKTTHDVHTKSQYSVLGNQWVSHESIESAVLKSCFASVNNFGGVMVRSLELDDHTGTECGQGKFPFHTAVYNTMARNGSGDCVVNEYLFASMGSAATHLNTNTPDITVLSLGYLLLWPVVAFGYQ